MFLIINPNLTKSVLILYSWLIAKDRSEEAWAILVKYHAEGDPNNEYVKAEFAEMVTAIQMDLETRKQSWGELISTTANIKRCALVAFIGVFSQWSGNGLVSYYLARVLETVGITAKATQNKVNLGLNCWNLVTGMTASLLVGITPRRVMYLTSVTGMFITFAAWTGASASYAETRNQAAAGAVVAMIFLYCEYPPFFCTKVRANYNYLLSLFLTCNRPLLQWCPPHLHLYHRSLSLLYACKRYSRRSNLLSRSRILQYIRQSDRISKHWMEILYCVYSLACC